MTLNDGSGNIVAVSQTDSNGEYLFVDFPIGVNTVEETNKGGFSDVIDVDGPNDNTITTSVIQSALNRKKNYLVDERAKTTPVPTASRTSETTGVQPKRSYPND